MVISRDYSLNEQSVQRPRFCVPWNLKNINTTPAENKVTEPRSMLRGNTFIGIQASSLH